MGNRQILAQALANLTDNAIKYTPLGGKVVLTAGHVESGGRAAPMLAVADSGPGIPMHLRSKALERFSRLEPERSTPGNGLGLSLVNAVAQLHEATLELTDNAPGLKVQLIFAAPKRQQRCNAGSIDAASIQAPTRSAQSAVWQRKAPLG